MNRCCVRPFPCFCFAVFVLCIPMSYEFGAKTQAAATTQSPSAAHVVPSRPAAPVAHAATLRVQDTPTLERVRDDGARLPMHATVAAPVLILAQPRAFVSRTRHVAARDPLVAPRLPAVK